MQKNGSPNKPTTQGKIERFHQTLKRWLTANGPADTLDDLNTQLKRFTVIYNTQRPHRALNRQTPDTAYHATNKAFPVIETDHTIWRIRYDKVAATGTISLRYAGKLRHLAIGRAWTGHRVLIPIHAQHTMVIDRNTGTIVAER